MRRVTAWLVLMAALAGCAASAPAPSVRATPQAAETESFEQYVRRRASQALNQVGATDEQKTEVDALLAAVSGRLYGCVGGSQRRLLKTLGILAASENQGQALQALEEADIPLTDKCVMVGSDLITRFSELLNEGQREALVAQWQ